MLLRANRPPKACRADGGTPSQNEYACVAGPIVLVSSTGSQMMRGAAMSLELTMPLQRRGGDSLREIRT